MKRRCHKNLYNVVIKVTNRERFSIYIINNNDSRKVRAHILDNMISYYAKMHKVYGEKFINRERKILDETTRWKRTV